MAFTMATRSCYIYGPLTQPSLVCWASEEASVTQLQGLSRNSCLLSVIHNFCRTNSAPLSPPGDSPAPPPPGSTCLPPTPSGSALGWGWGGRGEEGKVAPPLGSPTIAWCRNYQESSCIFHWSISRPLKFGIFGHNSPVSLASL